MQIIFLGKSIGKYTQFVGKIFSKQEHAKFSHILASKLGNSSGEFLKVFHLKTPKTEQSCSKTEFKLKIDDIVRKFKSL